VAGVTRLASEGRLDRATTVVCILTGHGLKDPDVWTDAVAIPDPIPPAGVMDEARRLMAAPG